MVDMYLGTDLENALAMAKQESIDDPMVKEWVLSIGEQLPNEDEQLIIDAGFVIKSRRQTTIGEAPMETFWTYELVKPE